MRALVSAYINDARFGSIASALSGARLGKRATKAALEEIARVGDALGGAALDRAASLSRALDGSQLS
jgi:hypothetical protein